MATFSADGSGEIMLVEDLGIESAALAIDGYTVEFDKFSADRDPSEYFVGLPDDACQAWHWGYLFEGELTYTYTDGTVDEITAGQAYVVRPGHRPKWRGGTRALEFSRTDELEETMAVITANMERLSG